MPALAQERDFDVPAQPAIHAIPALARQAQVQIVAPARDLARIRTPAIKGRMDIRFALQRLIAGTPLHVASNDGQTITLRSSGGPNGARGSSQEVKSDGALSSRTQTGTISGVVATANGDTLRDATITIDDGGKHYAASTADDGSYTVHDVPVGTARVTVSFVGYVSTTQEAAILPHGTARIDFSLQQSGRHGQAAVTGDIVVNGEREGEASSIMAQRREMQIADVMSTDTYGDIAGGNPAEFLKYMPGVDVDGTNGTAITAYLRGLPADYTRTQLNGMDLISANANTGAASARVFSYESLSLAAIDSVTIYKTTGADQDADAPAGIIDLRTKHAYDRKKPLLTFSIDGFTHENMLDGNTRTGPQSHGWGGQRFLPEGSLFFADSFFNHRLGVMFSLGIHNQYYEREQITMSRNYKPTTKSPDPLAYSSLAAYLEARQTTRRSGSVQLDFKANDHLSFSLLSVLFRSDVHANDNTITLTTGARTNGVSGDPLQDFTTLNPATTKTIESETSDPYKVNNGNIIAPRFDYDNGNWHLDGYFAYSDANSYYDSPHAGQVGSFIPTVTSTGNFSMTRGSESLMYTDWAVAQTSGPDWSSPGSYNLSATPEIRTTNGSTAFIFEKSGGLNARYNAHLGKVPVTFQVGFKIADTIYRYADTSGDNLYTYTGPLANAQLLAAVTNPPNVAQWKKTGVSITSLSGSSYIPTIDLSKLYQMYVNDPDQWTHTLSAANYAASTYSNNTRFEENIKSVYAMATADLTPKLKLRAGLRAEWTNNTSFSYVPLPADQVSGATVDGTTCAVTKSTGIATTIPCVDYQFSNGIQRIKGNYFNLFPSASLKWTIGRSVDIDAGYSRTILRPELDATSGTATIDDVDETITIPNPGLQPALSDNFSVRASRYFRSVGLASVGFYYNRIKGLAVENEGLTADQVGSAAAPFASNPEYANYTYSTYQKLGTVTIKGIEVSLQHSFSWLPPPFDGLSIRGGFMHNEPNQLIPRIGNNIGSAAVIYEKGPVRLYVNLLWNDDKYRSTTPSWFQARSDLTISGRVKLIRHWEAFFSINNVLNQPYNVMVPGSLATTATDFPNHSAIYVQNGRTGTLGIRARF